MYEHLIKYFDKPDEVREFPKGRFELVTVRGLTIGRPLANLLTLKRPSANAAVTVVLGSEMKGYSNPSFPILPVGESVRVMPAAHSSCRMNGWNALFV